MVTKLMMKYQYTASNIINDRVKELETSMKYFEQKRGSNGDRLKDVAKMERIGNEEKSIFGKAD